MTKDAYLRQAEAMIIEHENLRLFPYRCPAGKLTIGIGRNIEDNGISEQEALFLFRNDLNYCIQDLYAHVDRFWLLSDARKAALVDMRFNLGLPRFLAFKKMLAAVNEGDYEQAAREMLHSKWAGQVPERASELAGLMRNG